MENFLFAEATFQTFGGNSFSFDRDIAQARMKVRQFHRHYNGNPQQFNYFGEWHSHPHSTIEPSPADNSMMWQILSRTDESVNFLVLLIVKLNQQSKLDTGATAFLKSGHKLECTTFLAPNKKRKLQ